MAEAYFRVVTAIIGKDNLNGARLPDGHRLFTAPCGIRTKWTGIAKL